MENNTRESLIRVLANTIMTEIDNESHDYDQLDHLVNLQQELLDDMEPEKKEDSFKVDNMDLRTIGRMVDVDDIFSEDFFDDECEETKKEKDYEPILFEFFQSEMESLMKTLNNVIERPTSYILAKVLGDIKDKLQHKIDCHIERGEWV